MPSRAFRVYIFKGAGAIYRRGVWYGVGPEDMPESEYPSCYRKTEVPGRCTGTAVVPPTYLLKSLANPDLKKNKNWSWPFNACKKKTKFAVGMRLPGNLFVGV